MLNPPKRRGRSRANVAVILPGSIFQTLRAVGIPDLMIVRAIGVSRGTIQRACAGHSWSVSLSVEEFGRLKAFCAEKLAMAEAAAAALTCIR